VDEWERVAGALVRLAPITAADKAAFLALQKRTRKLEWPAKPLPFALARVMAAAVDGEGTAEDMMNLESIVTCAVGHPHWEAQLKGLIERHAAETGSLKARQILADWAEERANFIQICPKEMLVHLPVPLSDERQAVPAE